MAESKDRDALVLHIKNAKLSDLDKQAAELKDRYEIYRTMRAITSTPGDLKMDFNVRSGKTAVTGQAVSGDLLKADAARFRILQGIKQHVIANVGDVQAFDLAFDLSCKKIPEELTLPELPGLPGGIGGPSM